MHLPEKASDLWVPVNTLTGLFWRPLGRGVCVCVPSGFLAFNPTLPKGPGPKGLVGLSWGKLKILILVGVGVPTKDQLYPNPLSHLT